RRDDSPHGPAPVIASFVRREPGGRHSLLVLVEQDDHLVPRAERHAASQVVARRAVGNLHEGSINEESWRSCGRDGGTDRPILSVPGAAPPSRPPPCGGGDFCVGELGGAGDRELNDGARGGRRGRRRGALRWAIVGARRGAGGASRRGG